MPDTTCHTAGCTEPLCMLACFPGFSVGFCARCTVKRLDEVVLPPKPEPKKGA
jgi:hypothetical protein